MTTTPTTEPGPESWLPVRSRWALALERLALLIERPANRLIGNAQLNPFYHTGKIAVLLLALVAVTGFYLFLFFQYGYDASYAAVTRMNTQPIARLMRAVHRYASGALVITTLLHGLRTLFMERFRGPRWLAWLTGLVMTFVLWLAGVTGYWVLWDSRAQVITDEFVGFIDRFTPWGAALMVRLVSAESGTTSWIVVFLIIIVHILLFLVTVFFFWLHLRRLSRPKWVPEAHWIVGAAVVLTLISAFFPADLLAPASTAALPDRVTVDPIFLFYLPLNQTPFGPWLWIGLWLATLIAAVLPWFPRHPHPPRVRVIAEKCTGCTKCAQDCPYDALHMVERSDDSPYQLIAVAQPDKCVGCGICIGSCDDFLAITLGDVDPERVWDSVAERLTRAQAAHPDRTVKLIFTCARHAALGARPYLDGYAGGDSAVEVVVLPCSGAVAPGLLPRAMAAGAAEVAVVGCPPDDCANRLGNVWEEARVTNERVPRLRKRHDHDPITAAWLPPDDFALALPLTRAGMDEEARPDFLTTRIFQWLNWRNFVVGFVLLALVLLGQIYLTGLPFTVYADQPVVVQVVRPRSELPLELTVDDVVVWRSDDPLPGPQYGSVTIAPGTRRLRLAAVADDRPLTIVHFDEVLTVAPGAIVRPVYTPAPRPPCPEPACSAEP